MQTITEESVITQKTRELCQTILDQPEVQNIRRQIESFMTNDEAKTQYQLLSEKGEFLQHKQQQGLTLSNEEIADFEQSREALFNNPVARGFLDAQQEMHKMQESLGQYVAKTFELGRVPSPDDLQSGSCGSGCGCH
jgi:cell fate (sporulation/competence/biofilm development) regulator YlbF (YheA/YmcA/DUF963 family)